MKLLVIAPFVPWPLTAGGKIRVFNIIKYLSIDHEVTLACLSDSREFDSGPLPDLCAHLIIEVRPQNMARDLVAFLFGSLPFNSRRYESTGLRQQLSVLKASQKFDLVICEYSFLWPYAQLFQHGTVVLDSHNIEYHIIQQLRLHHRNPLLRVLYRLEERKLRFLEHEAWQACSLCLTVSEHERGEIIATGIDPLKVLTISNGVDLKRFIYRVRFEPPGPLLLLAGLDYAPNLDGARFFLTKILPQLRLLLPGLEIDLVGREFWRLRELLPQAGVVVHEDVQDILSYFNKAGIMVVPLRQGAGTRIKILEAMAAGLPVVTTSKGCEGLEVEHGRELLIADDPTTFAQEVVRLLGDQGLRQSIAGNARAFVAEHYSWETLIKRMTGGFQGLLSSSSLRGMER